jgi:lysophospholipase L1-like esterase
MVFNRSRDQQAARQQLHLQTRNRFGALSEPNPQTSSEPNPQTSNNNSNSHNELTNNLVGDSLVRGLGNRFTELNPLNRIAEEIPGANLSQVRAAVSKMTTDKRSSIIVLAGGNDLFLRKGRTGHTEPFMANTKALIKTVKAKSEKGILIGLVPRLNTGREAYSKAIALNRRVRELCDTEGVRFINPWYAFENKRALYGKDGIHLNAEGSRQLADIINARLYKDLGKPTKQGNPGTNKPHAPTPPPRTTPTPPPRAHTPTPPPQAEQRKRKRKKRIKRKKKPSPAPARDLDSSSSSNTETESETPPNTTTQTPPADPAGAASTVLTRPERKISSSSSSDTSFTSSRQDTGSDTGTSDTGSDTETSDTETTVQPEQITVIEAATPARRAPAERDGAPHTDPLATTTTDSGSDEERSDLNPRPSPSPPRRDDRPPQPGNENTSVEPKTT